LEFEEEELKKEKDKPKSTGQLQQATLEEVPSVALSCVLV
jgi:hypothetical protein